MIESSVVRSVLALSEFLPDSLTEGIRLIEKLPHSTVGPYFRTFFCYAEPDLEENGGR
jgi:hypothetical protein